MTDETTLGQTLKKLREDRGWSQEETAKRAGVAQTVVSRLERDEFKRPSATALSGLATAFGVTVRYRDGNISRSIGPTTRFSTDALLGGSDPRTPEEEETPLESALFAVMDSKKYKAPVFDAARRVIRETFRFTREDADLEAQARSYLEAAARLHREGKPMTTPAILSYVINGSLPGAEEVARERAAAVNAKADEELRAKGMEPGQGTERLKAAVAKRMGKGG